ncbi:acyl-CoA dehydrogenase family protein [Altererythrobacter sp. TH136]|uniref:acyl-CoA dehydrogenase family protein n=1 Tax=Altererythrobacter sp. TH136 TaxID=2067415 RepID=UPI001AEF4321|nr:acyl-CoA dehydrogenase family protein [Altererythrobacter sp. TH136]
MTEFLEPFERMLTLLFPADRVRAIDAGAEWQHEREEVEQSGFLDALVLETAGGAGMSVADAAQLWRALGRNAAPIAIGEAMVARAGLCAEAEVLLLAAALSGAADRVLAMSAAYAGERSQFGKPIGRQQALQQQLAVMAEDCVAIRLAVELAAAGEPPDRLRIAVAKSVASSAAPRIANAAHAVHGAIGISAEYDLQLYTGRLHEWRAALGSETRWNRELGHALLVSHAPVLDWTRARLFGES